MARVPGILYSRSGQGWIGFIICPIPGDYDARILEMTWFRSDNSVMIGADTVVDYAEVIA